MQLFRTVSDIFLGQLVLRLNENNEFVTLKFDVSELVFFVRMTYEKLFVVLANTLQCFRITVFTSLKICDKKFRANRIYDLLSGHFPFLSVRRRARGGEKDSGTHPLTRLILNRGCPGRNPKTEYKATEGSAPEWGASLPTRRSVFEKLSRAFRLNVAFAVMQNRF